MSLPLPQRFRVPAIVTVSMAVIIMVGLASPQGRVAKMGQTVQLDDFFFTVRDAKRLTTPKVDGHGNSAVLADYVVTLTIDNQAKRVPFRFSEQSLALIDTAGAGRVYHVDPERQRARYEATTAKYADPLVLKAGESATQDYIFAIPAAHGRASLEIPARRMDRRGALQAAGQLHRSSASLTRRTIILITNVHMTRLSSDDSAAWPNGHESVRRRAAVSPPGPMAACRDTETRTGRRSLVAATAFRSRPASARAGWS